eukprot:PhM_4_TR4081/c0_g1_i1/m.35157
MTPHGADAATTSLWPSPSRSTSAGGTNTNRFASGWYPSQCCGTNCTSIATTVTPPRTERSGTCTLTVSSAPSVTTTPPHAADGWHRSVCVYGRTRRRGNAMCSSLSGTVLLLGFVTRYTMREPWRRSPSTGPQLTSERSSRCCSCRRSSTGMTSLLTVDASPSRPPRLTTPRDSIGQRRRGERGTGRKAAAVSTMSSVYTTLTPPPATRSTVMPKEWYAAARTRVVPSAAAQPVAPLHGCMSSHGAKFSAQTASSTKSACCHVPDAMRAPWLWRGSVSRRGATTLCSPVDVRLPSADDRRRHNAARGIAGVTTCTPAGACVMSPPKPHRAWRCPRVHVTASKRRGVASPVTLPRRCWLGMSSESSKMR